MHVLMTFSILLHDRPVDRADEPITVEEYTVPILTELESQRARGGVTDDMVCFVWRTLSKGAVFRAVLCERQGLPSGLQVMELPGVRQTLAKPAWEGCEGILPGRALWVVVTDPRNRHLSIQRLSWVSRKEVS